MQLTDYTVQLIGITGVLMPLACELDARTSVELFTKFGFTEDNSIIKAMFGPKPSIWQLRAANFIQLAPFVIGGLILPHNAALGGIAVGALIVYSITGIFQGLKNRKKLAVLNSIAKK